MSKKINFADMKTPADFMSRVTDGFVSVGNKKSFVEDFISSTDNGGVKIKLSYTPTYGRKIIDVWVKS